MKNEDGYEHVNNYAHARARAIELNLKESEFRYVDCKEKIMGARLPHHKNYYFIGPDVNPDYIRPLVRR